MSSISLKAKLLAFSGLMVALIVAIGAVGVNAMRTLSQEYGHVATINLGNAESLGRMRFYGTEIARNYLRLLIPGATETLRKEALDKMDKSIEEYVAADKVYQGVPFVEGEQALYDAMSAKWSAFLALTKEAAESAHQTETKKRERFLELVLTDLPKARQAHSDALETLIEFQNTQAKQWVDRAQATDDRSSALAIVLAVASFLLAAAIGYLFSRSLSGTLRGVATGIGDSSGQVSTASGQLSAASQQLSHAANEQAASLAETVASVEELTSMVKLNADNSREAATLSATSRKAAEEGEGEIRKLNEVMGEISDSSKKIEEIINVIDDIAFQTNLLALNAAVEAARAGEQGKGFAVVAEAVRALAQRSGAAAKDITTLIKDSVSKIERGAKGADEGAKMLKSIVTTVAKVSDLNSEIASASREQANGLTQISTAMNQLDQATQKNAASAEETAAASEEMSSQAILMRELVSTLSALVDGGGAHAVATPAAVTVATRAATPGAGAKVLTLTRPTTRAAKAASHDAKSVIPFDSDDAPAGKVGTTEGF